MGSTSSDLFVNVVSGPLPLSAEGAFNFMCFFFFFLSRISKSSLSLTSRQIPVRSAHCATLLISPSQGRFSPAPSLYLDPTPFLCALLRTSSRSSSSFCPSEPPPPFKGQLSSSIIFWETLFNWILNSICSDSVHEVVWWKIHQPQGP